MCLVSSFVRLLSLLERFFLLLTYLDVFTLSFFFRLVAEEAEQMIEDLHFDEDGRVNYDGTNTIF